MKRSIERILTTHTGALPGPPEFDQVAMRMRNGESYDLGAFAGMVQRSTAEVIRRQAEIGIDVVSDGQLGMLEACSITQSGSRALKLRRSRRVKSRSRS